jgi:hypothetical protein
MYREIIIGDSPAHGWQLGSESYAFGGYDDDGLELDGEHAEINFGPGLTGPYTFADSLLARQEDALYLHDGEELAATDPDIGKYGTNQRWGFEMWIKRDDYEAFEEGEPTPDPPGPVVVATNGRWSLTVNHNRLTLTLGTATLHADAPIGDDLAHIGFIFDSVVGNRRLIINGASYVPVLTGTVPADITTAAGDLVLGSGLIGSITFPVLYGSSITTTKLARHYSYGRHGYELVSVTDPDSMTFSDSDIEAYVPDGQVTSIIIAP